MILSLYKLFNYFIEIKDLYYLQFDYYNYLL